MPAPFVRVVGVALALSACHRDPAQLTERPVAPPDPAAPDPAPGEGGGRGIPSGGVPVGPLPTWDEVPSRHPEGATNPPRPLLLVSREPPACFKRWVGGMMPPGPQESALDGEVVATPADAVGATAIACPPGQPAALLAAHDAWAEGGRRR